MIEYIMDHYYLYLLIAYPTSMAIILGVKYVYNHIQGRKDTKRFMKAMDRKNQRFVRDICYNPIIFTYIASEISKNNLKK